MHDHSLSSDSRHHSDAACRSGTRNRFFAGKLMKANEFALEQAYGIRRRRLVNRAVHGWGVVYGLALERRDAPGRPAEAEIGAGFALDRHGREIVVLEPLVLGQANAFLLDKGNGCRPEPIEHAAPGRYVLAVHYAERRFGDALLPERCGCDTMEKNFVCETAVLSLRRLCDEECPCAEGPCARACPCEVVDSCGNAGRGPHACLCRWVTHAEVPGEAPELCEWGGYRLDPADGIDLACVRVEAGPDRCTPIVIAEITDACGPRRVVKGNDLLYDLIRGCDLTRISNVSWDAWLRTREVVPWESFAAMFGPNDRPDGRTDFVVKFSGPIQAESPEGEAEVLVLEAGSVMMSIVTIEQSTGWQMRRGVPIRRIVLEEIDAGGGPLGRQMRLYVSPRWVRDEIDSGGESWLTGRRPFSVEIEIRGDWILDCHGQSVDATAVGRRAVPSGNGTPGGTFISSFRVEAKPVDGPAYVE